MISIHCLRTHVVLWLSGKSACLVKGSSLVQIRAVPHFHIILLFKLCLPWFFFKMIFTHCLLFYVALWLSGESGCLVNRRSIVQIRAVPYFQIILLFVIMFTLFVFQNDFHPLPYFETGSVA